MRLSKEAKNRQDHTEFSLTLPNPSTLKNGSASEIPVRVYETSLAM